MNNTNPNTIRNLTTKGKRSKQKIIDAALTIFNEKGYQSTTIQDICKIANIAVGTFYHHFISKEALLMAMSDEINTSLLNFYDLVEKTSYQQAILKVLNFHIESYAYYGPELIANMYRGVCFSETNAYELSESAHVQILYDAFSKGQYENQFSKEYSLDFLVESVVGIFFLDGMLWCNHHDTLYFKAHSYSKIEQLLNFIAEGDVE